ncbi:MAG TPA: glycosyltransferase family 1 protein [Thermoprotei archaeon]|nr:glycosyltransferase family 1 protein [Thermoprotei archaeon]
MRILFITRRFYPDIIGGGEVSAYHIAKSLVDLDNDVFVLTFTEGKFKKEIIDGIKIYRYPIFYTKIPILSHFLNLEGMYIQMAYRTLKFLDKIKPDVVHLLNIESIFFTSFILKIKGIPSFATINGPMISCYVGDCVDYRGNSCIKCSPKKMFFCIMNKGKTSFIGYFGRFFKFIYGVFHILELKFFAKKIDKLFPVSKAIKKLLIENGFNEDKLEVIHNPIPISDKIKTNLKEKLNIQNRRVILYAGRVTEEKGVHRVVEAMRYIDNAIFLIVGRGSYCRVKTPYYKSLEEMVKKYDLKEKVKFIGYVEPDNMKEYYSIADLVVLPCTIYESLSRMLLEACSYGIPIIASNVGGNSEIVEDGKNGILLKTLETEELVKAIKYILENPKIYEEMSKYCKEKVRKKFSLEIIGGKILDEYKLAIREKIENA